MSPKHWNDTPQMNEFQIDLNTLLVVTIANIAALAIVSPAVMGWRISEAARSARLSLVLYATSWIPMILSNLWPETLLDRFLSTLSVGGFAASNWMLFNAMSHWLGPRRFERTVKLLIYLIPVGYCILFSRPCKTPRTRMNASFFGIFGAPIPRESVNRRVTF